MKRGASGLSLVVAIDKPSGMTSHDVVNRVRRVFGEKRVGHTGTLDPLATGVLPVCIGPATRLDRFLTAHDKRYRTTLALGAETDTDDAQGDVVATRDVTGDLLDGDFAEAYVAGLVGSRMQVPPQYSAIKKNGKRAYELARAGENVDLEPRPIEVLEANLVERREEDGRVFWTIDFAVSKGTYIRALARDIGRELGCLAHVASLERLSAGAIGIDECVSLETLEALREQAAIDPVRLLGFRFAFADDFEKSVVSGARLDASALVPRDSKSLPSDDRCACVGVQVESGGCFTDGELVSVVFANRLKGIYRFDSVTGALAPECVFSTGVFRG